MPQQRLHLRGPRRGVGLLGVVEVQVFRHFELEGVLPRRWPAKVPRNVAALERGVVAEAIRPAAELRQRQPDKLRRGRGFVGAAQNQVWKRPLVNGRYPAPDGVAVPEQHPAKTGLRFVQQLLQGGVVGVEVQGFAAGHFVGCHRGALVLVNGLAQESGAGAKAGKDAAVVVEGATVGVAV